MTGLRDLNLAPEPPPQRTESVESRERREEIAESQRRLARVCGEPIPPEYDRREVRR